MRKVWTIAVYDLIATFRQPVALIFMLALPFALTLIMAAAFGNPRGLGRVPVVVVNHDNGMLGQVLTAMLQSEALADLLETTVMTDELAARAYVDADQVAAAVIIPPRFSASVMGPSLSGAEVEIYANPGRPISAGVVRSIVRQFADSVNVGIAGGQAVFATLARERPEFSNPSNWQRWGQRWGQRVARLLQRNGLEERVRLVSLEASTEDATFRPVAFIAPSMALFTLMFTMTAGGRALLEERRRGTLQRLFSTPTSPFSILLGKITGIWLTGWAQLAILLVTTALIFRLSWGSPFLVALVCIMVVLAASGWGVLIAAFSRTPGQANAIGTALSLVFGISAGHFFPRENLPAWLQTASRISPNAWGLDAFRTLLEGGTWNGLLPTLGALLGMAMILYAIAALALRRQWTS